MIHWPAPDPTSPYYCHGPTLLSLSGGRTSGFMLYHVLAAHGGVLPGYVIVAFANTGREVDETYRFVQEMASRWGVRIYWVEWRPGGPRVRVAYPAGLELTRNLDADERGRRRAERKRIREMSEAERRFAIVGPNSADREGKWFGELIRKKQYLPNQDMRYCTEKLKIDTMKWLMIALGFDRWHNMVGLRADEMHRVLKQVLRNASGLERYISTCPMAVAGVTKRAVMLFWLGRNADPKRLLYPLPQGFDLGLYDWEGNCDLCFLKGRAKKAAMIRSRPAVPAWWAEMERLATALTSVRTAYMKRFDKRESIDTLVKAVESSPELADFSDGGGAIECGAASCIGDDQSEPFDDSARIFILDQLRKAQTTPVPMPTIRRVQPAAVGDLFEIAA